ncbi:MAG: DUF3408 domain-containing protein [Muribaculaceae bacterium]|nr:DUF3408 domain-containing protein [Muribaculaceae bacterium]
MPKKSDAQITPDNFLDSYKPVSPRRKGDAGASEAQTELPKVEMPKENGGAAENVVLQSRQNDVAMSLKEYQRIFLRPNFGESMRYGKTYYVSKDDCKKIKALMRCFGENYDRFPLSVFIHNLLADHFARFSNLIDEMMSRQSNSNPFNTSDE